MKTILLISGILLINASLFAQFEPGKTVYSTPEGDVYKVVNEMPRFPGCEEMEGTKEEIKECAVIKLMEFIQDNLEYPEEAMAEKIQGRVFISFIVEKDGFLSNFKLVRDIGGGCGEEAMRIVKLMDDLDMMWRPGIQNGKAVRVQFNIAVHFRLN
ncbi:MAG: energy transducer TonB [Saprospiraceae bacterium]|nr:energy transducer TonB [Saprospiraceae bacterium]MCB9322836.1 energy transducer TonB [Lewinellaceae bacterium]